MISVQISNRLLQIAKFVPKSMKVADIGSDHALLPSYLIFNDISPFVIAGEVNDGPYQAAIRQVKGLGMEKHISVRKGNGLNVLIAGEADVITIAGMGGALIVDILENGKDKLKDISRLILQPNVGEPLVRRWLDSHNWDIFDEVILEEDEKIYEIIVAEQRKDVDDLAYKGTDWTKEDMYRLGPILFKSKSPILLKKWTKELEKTEYILKQIDKSQKEQEKQKKKEKLLNEIKWLTEVISCLQKDRTSYKSLNS